MLALFASILLSPRHEPSSLAALSQARAAFETRLGKTEPSLACMMMGAGNEALFPFGVANRRLLVERIGSLAPRLLYQSLHRGRGQTDWALPLTERYGKGVRPKSGALRRLLWDEGYSVKTARLGRMQRAALDVNKPFALYTVYGPTELLEVQPISSEGVADEWDAYYDYPTPKGMRPRDFRPILAEEARFLGLGTERWHGPGPLRYSHVAKGQDSADAKIVAVP